MNNFYYDVCRFNGSLEHYGILGMKWGVRRTPEQLGHKRTARHTGEEKPSKQERVRSDREKAYSNRRTLSDEELQSRIRRLELEKRFRDLSEEDLYRGRKMVKDILIFAGPAAMKTMATGAALYSAKAIMTQKFNWKDAAEYIAPKPKKK